MKASKDEEEILRHAANILNEKVEEYSKIFNKSDYQDLLAVVSFDSIVEILKIGKKQKLINKDLSSSLEKISEMIKIAK